MREELSEGLPAGLQEGLPAPGARQVKNLRAWCWASYTLHLAVAVAGVTLLDGPRLFSLALLLLALVVDLVQREAAGRTWLKMHFSWRIRNALWAGAGYVIVTPLGLWLLIAFGRTSGIAPLAIMLILGWPLFWLLTSLWLVWRTVRGMVAMQAGRWMPDKPHGSQRSKERRKP